MSIDHQQSIPDSENPQHARELLARLYREIGLLAVAEALQVPMPKDDAELDTRCETLPIPRKDIAA